MTLSRDLDLTGSTGSTGLSGLSGYPHSGPDTPLDAVRDWLGTYIRTTSEADLDLLALWCVHTHFATELYTTPRLLLDSVMPGSGKTTTLDHLNRLCLHPLQAASLSSPALLARVLAGGPRTILIDEADRSLDPKKEGVGDLLAILNSGYRKGASRPVLTPTKGGGWDVEEMPTHAPVAIAGNSPHLPDDTLSRCVKVLLMPDLDGSVEDSDWELIEDDADELADRIDTWAEHVREDIRMARPELPGGIKGRAKERWMPLKRVSVIVGGRWPEVVDRLASAEADRLAVESEDGLARKQRHLVLAEHIADVWPEGETFTPTTQLLDALKAKHPEEWGEFSRFGKPLTTQAMGRMLAGRLGVHTDRPVRPGPRGYLLADLGPVLVRLGLEVPVEPDKPVEPGRPDKPVKPDKPADQRKHSGEHCRDCGQRLLLESADGRCSSCAGRPVGRLA